MINSDVNLHNTCVTVDVKGRRWREDEGREREKMGGKGEERKGMEEKGREWERGRREVKDEREGKEGK